MSYTPARGPLKGQTFANEYRYRDALAQQRGFRSRGAARRSPRPISRTRDVRELPGRERRAREQALDAIALMRRDDTLTIAQAARRAGTTVDTMLRYAGAALEKRGGRYHAKPYDRLARAMEFLTPEGVISLEVRDSRSRRRIGEYMNAVKRYVNTGDARGLRKFQGRAIRIDGRGYPFATDTATLDRLASAGELGFDNIYSEAA